ncbi:hypothetical protein BV378_21850 [Nostoc sp. RF31YmG]|nr:hypothetical protein BV378_21850 [Nostoc sp. RF31YmG]
MQKPNRYNNFQLDNIYPYALVLIVVFALIIRFIGLSKGIWIDEYFSFRWDEGDNIGKLILNLRDYDKPPFYFILLYLWTRISHNEAFCRLLSVVFDIGTIIVVMRWMKQYSSLASILGGLYFATTPIMLRYSQEIRLYSLLIFATALAFFFASYTTKYPEKLSGYVGVALSLTLAISTHLVAIMLIAPIFIFIVLMTVLENKRNYLIKLIVAITVPCLAFLFFYFFYLTKLPDKTGDWWMPPVSWNLISSTAQYVFGLSTLFFHSKIDNVITFIFFAIVTIALIFGKWKQNYPFLVAAIIFWVEIIIYSVMKNPIFFYRIILPGIVPFIGFLVLQITSIEIKNVRKASIILLAILSLIFTTNWVTVQAYRPVEYYKQTAQLIESKLQPNDLIVFYPGYIADTVKYHFKQIHQDSEIVAWNANDLSKMEFDINDKLKALNAKKLTNIFLVARVDLVVKAEEYKNVILAIKSKIKSPLTIKSFLIISHDFSFVKNPKKPNIFMEILLTEFGQPLLYKDKKSYVLSEYKLLF